MCDITQTFTAIRKSLESVHPDTRSEIFQTIIKEMDLKGRDEYLAMKAYGLLMCTGLDYEEAYEVLGKETVDEWIKNGSFADDFHPMAYKNLDYWCDPIARQKYYEEYLEGVKLHRTGSIGVKLHPNFTLAEIEHTMRNMH